MNEQEHATQPAGQAFHTRVYGDTAAEIEIAALEEALTFFGEGTQLEVDKGYHTWKAVTDGDIREAKGKRYHASVCVRAVNR